MLFDVSSVFRFDSDIHRIVNNYKVFIQDEFPMLYTGTNSLGNHIIGSLLCEDEEHDIFRFIHLVVLPKEYFQFIKGKISYRNLIENKKSLFLVDKKYNDEEIRSFYAPVSIIPDNYLPRPLFYCPNVDFAIGLDFQFVLKGLLADSHEGIASAVGSVYDGIDGALSLLAGLIGTTYLKPCVLLTPSTSSSFSINFRIKLSSNDMYYSKLSEQAVAKYFSESLDYALNDLSREVKLIIDKKTEGSKFEAVIEKSIEDVFNTLSINFGDADKARAIKEFLKLPDEFVKVGEQIGNGFDTILISTTNELNEVKPIGQMDVEKYEDFILISNSIEENLMVVEDDTVFIDYEIQVYHLNTKTRRGNASIKNTNALGLEILDAPRIEIAGETDLLGSNFIDSMDTGSWITVKAKAHKVNGRFKLISILH